MDLLPKVAAGRQVIDAYGDGGFRITGVAWREPVLIFPDRVEPWPVRQMADLSEAAFERVIANQPAIELLLIGCGPMIAAVPSALRAAVRARGLKLEALDTGAACRTYNLLMIEGRSVAAALIPV